MRHGLERGGRSVEQRLTASAPTILDTRALKRQRQVVGPWSFFFFFCWRCSSSCRFREKTGITNRRRSEAKGVEKIKKPKKTPSVFDFFFL